MIAPPLPRDFYHPLQHRRTRELVSKLTKSACAGRSIADSICSRLIVWAIEPNFSRLFLSLDAPRASTRRASHECAGGFPTGGWIWL